MASRAIVWRPLLYTIAVWQKSVNNKVGVTKGVGIDS